MVQGKTDDLRIQRRFFYVMYCVQQEKPSDMLDVFPLMFDDELQSKESDSEDKFSDFQLYTLAKDLGYFQNPLN